MNTKIVKGVKMSVNSITRASFSSAHLRYEKGSTSENSGRKQKKETPRYIVDKDLNGTLFESTLLGGGTQTWIEYKDTVLIRDRDQKPESREKYGELLVEDNNAKEAMTKFDKTYERVKEDKAFLEQLTSFLNDEVERTKAEIEYLSELTEYFSKLTEQIQSRTVLLKKDFNKPINPTEMIEITKTDKPSGLISFDTVSEITRELKAYGEEKAKFTDKKPIL